MHRVRARQAELAPVVARWQQAEAGAAALTIRRKRLRDCLLGWLRWALSRAQQQVWPCSLGLHGM